jgi:GNAT superfamily N-acetyltransferase
VAAGAGTLLGLGRRRAPAVRPVRPGEPVARVLDTAGFGPHVGRLLGYPRHSPHGEIFVAETPRGRLVGGACCASFGRTGWIGALGVLPRSRHQGTGTALTEAAVAWLRERGAETVLLYATELGRSVYERLGFVAEAPASAWRGSPPQGPLPDGTRRLREGDRPALLALDRAATGEDRSPVLAQIPALVGTAIERHRCLVAGALETPWGAGPSVVAADADAGRSVLLALAREPQPLTITVPDDNPYAGELLASWGFRVVNVATRMRLGPPVPHDPRRMFGLTNLFWG